jgi:hypothetical protein
VIGEDGSVFFWNEESPFIVQADPGIAPLVLSDGKIFFHGGESLVFEEFVFPEIGDDNFDWPEMGIAPEVFFSYSDSIGDPEALERKIQLMEEQRVGLLEYRQQILEKEQALRESLIRKEEKVRREMEYGLRERERAMRDGEQARREAIEQKLHALEKQQAIRHKERAELLRRMEAEIDLAPGGRLVIGRPTSYSIEDQLVADGFIRPGESFSFDLNGKRLKINGQKQPDPIFQRYQRLYEHMTGEPLNEKSRIEIKR